MGPWRGPLPPRRISLQPVLGTFIDKALEAQVAPSSRAGRPFQAGADQVSSPELRAADPGIKEDGGIQISGTLSGGARDQVMGGYFPGSPMEPERRPAKTQEAQAGLHFKQHGLG